MKSVLDTSGAPFAHVGMKIYKSEHVPLFTTTEDGTLSPVWMLRPDSALALYVNPLVWDVFVAIFSRPIAEQKNEPMWIVAGRGELAAIAARNLAEAYAP